MASSDVPYNQLLLDDDHDTIEEVFGGEVKTREKGGTMDSTTSRRTRTTYFDQMLFDGDNTTRPTGTLSMFQGVFVPCVLSMFSSILFLRIGYLVGQAGLPVALVLVLVSYIVVTLTTLSLSAISTNGLVKGGGAYYMISRSLGPEFGGSIGVLFFFANIFASGSYVVAFVEALVDNLPSLHGGHWVDYGLGSAVLFFCLLVCLVGPGAFGKASLGIFMIVMFSVFWAIINFFFAPETSDIHPPTRNHILNSTAELKYTGFNLGTFQENTKISLTRDYTEPMGQDVVHLSTVFGVFFNGVTGVMAGANMSGDLKNPGRAIPYGTLAAVGFTFIIYLILVFLTAATSPKHLLINNYLFLDEINIVPEIVLVGTFAATLSAALSTLIGASRIAQAISRDEILGPSLKFLSKEKGNPIRAVFLSWFLVQLVIMIGKINIIAPIVSMLFLLSYATLNFACFALRSTGAPNFRPTFKYFGLYSSFLGCFLCLVVMFFTEALYAGLSLIMMVLLFLYIHFRRVPVLWGEEVFQAIVYRQVRKTLLRLQVQSLKFWRPQVLLLVTNPRSSLNSVLFTNQLKKSGLLLLGNVIVGGRGRASKEKHKETTQMWEKVSRVLRLKAFVNVVISESIRDGTRAMLMLSGLGGMKPNMVFIKFYNEEYSTDEMQAHRNSIATKREQKKGMVEGLDELLKTIPTPSKKNKALVPEDWVAMLKDVLEFEKSVGVLRNFDQCQNRLEFARTDFFTGTQWYIDVWPAVPHSGQYLLNSQFLMQLGAILKMVGDWKKYVKIRVTMVVDDEDSVNKIESRLDAIFFDLRMEAVTQVISLDREEEQFYSSTLFEDLQETQRERCQALNNLMKKYTQKSCVLFTSLPDMPAEDSPESALRYIENLEILTGTIFCNTTMANNKCINADKLPPVLAIRGTEQVVTQYDEAI
eukprot:m.101172 g.101172  ORF g.101172 m.101172 type:complete len:928 (+) comp13734_c0_seq7:143-2926(+)